MLMAAATAAPSLASATCWDSASATYGVPANVLKAVAKTESGFDPKALHRNADSTTDIGLMQINSRWLPTLEKYGISQDDLKDSCTNLKVGAWILSNNARKLGWNWNAVGAYNVGCAKLAKEECDRRRNKYAWKIHGALQQVASLDGASPQRRAIPEYGSATQVSSGTPVETRAADRRTIIYTLASAEQVSAGNRGAHNGERRSASDMGDGIGGFMNYSDEAGDE